MASINVLLVDDETEFLELMSKRLSKRNVNLVTAESGEQALEILRAKSFDVVVLDVKMPGMSGIDVLREIRRSKPDVVAVMLTGHADLDYVEEGLALGAFDYLIKPVAFDELFAKITDAWRKRRNEF
ncbi:response regulator [Oceanidesulfovibrio indonesiensis]|uniref:Response regulator n=1 Tax=Oceanidesulfovibrio indonesiensis TaxID=54767 RepID=A0A7M3MAB6_9BACT|nr:response regulator [Oceanidesulfovibrio indonesiensis]TVM14578.1 response regulator [Oceanidesulfovibrio indonesiensis]